jgi:hypothetical protein
MQILRLRLRMTTREGFAFVRAEARTLHNCSKCPDDRRCGMYGPPPFCKRNVRVTCWSARMYPAFVGVRSPGLNGMRCALVLFSFAAFEGCFRIKVSRAPGSTVVPSHASPANLAGMSKSHMIQPSSLVCRCGNRGCDFQAWRFCQASCAGQVFQAAVCGTSGGR